MKSLKKLAVVLMALTMLFALAACGEKEEEKQTITFGTSADYAPFEFHTMVNGTDTIVGADIDLIEKLAADLGVNYEIKDISFDVLLNELQNGTIDVVIAGMAANEERTQQADASDVYYDAEYQRLCILKSNADKYKTFDDFEGVKVAAQTGTIQIGLAEENLHGCDLVTLQAVPDIFNNLLNGKVEAVLVDGNVGDGYIEQNDELTFVDLEWPPVDGMAVWVQKGDPKGLMETINKTIASIKESGDYYKWVEAAQELAGE